MVKRRSEEKHMHEAIETGKRNKEIIFKLKRWCKHIEIKQESAGMLASVYKLPIGLLMLSCPHSDKCTGSSNLENIAKDFIIDACKECNFHEEVHPNNYGKQVLEDERKLQECQLAERELELRTKKKLESILKSNLKKVLDSSGVTEQSILELVALLYNPDKNIETSKKLIEASKIAPEYFKNTCLEILVQHFSNPEYGSAIIETVENILNYTNELPEFCFKSAINCVESGNNYDKACLILKRYINESNLVDNSEIIKKVISNQYYVRMIGMLYEERVSYPDSIEFLAYIGELNFTFLINTLKEFLKINDKNTRININRLIQNLLPILPDLGLNLTRSIIYSFELDDDGYLEPADDVTTGTLAEIFLLFPEQTLIEIKDAYESVSNEAKSLLYRVFDAVIRKGVFNKDTEPKQNVLESSKIIIPELISTINNQKYILDVREQASDTISLIGKYAPQMMIDYLDALIGCLVIIIDESSREDKQPQIDSPLKQLEQMSIKSSYQKISREIAQSISGLLEDYPSKVIGTLKQIINNLDSKKQDKFKSELLGIYSNIDEQTIILESIPFLYKYLMDMDSPLIRGTALNFLSNVFMRHEQVVPDNMLDVLPILLMDTYVYVHKQAVRACRYAFTYNEQVAREIISLLLGIEKIYEKEDSHFCEDIVDAMLNIAKPYPPIYYFIIKNIVVKYCNSDDEYLAERMIRKFMWIVEDVPHFFNEWIRQVVLFYGRTRRDKFNSQEYSDRFIALRKIFESPYTPIARIIGDIKASAICLIKDDPWDGLNLVEILAYYEFHNEAVQLCEEIEKAHPTIKKNEGILRITDIYKALSKTELFIQAGNIDEADKLNESVCNKIQSFENEKLTKILLIQAKIRKQYIYSLNGFSLSNIQFHLTQIECLIEQVNAYMELFRHLPDYKVIKAWGFSLKALLHLFNYTQGTLEAIGNEERELKAAKSQVILISDLLSDNLCDKPFVKGILEIKETLSQINSIEDIKMLVEKFLLLSLPIYYSKSYNILESSLKQEKDDDYQPTEENVKFYIVKVLFYFERQPWANPQVIQSNVLYDIRAEINIPHWPAGFDRLELKPSSTLDSSHYMMSSLTVNKDFQGSYEKDITGQISFSIAQSIFSEPVVIRLVSTFTSRDGKTQPATIVGYHQLKVKMVDKNNFAFSCGYNSLDERILGIIIEIEKELPNVSSEEKKDFIRLLSGILNYQGNCAQQGLFKGICNISEAEFKAEVIKHLRLFIGEEITEEPNIAGGRIEISYRGIPAELKVEKNIKSRQRIIEHYKKQPVCYSSSRGKQLGILCILDLTEKINPPADIRNNIFTITPDIHGFEDQECMYPSKVVAVIIDGNTKKPSDYSK